MANVTAIYEKDSKLKKEDVESLRVWAEKQPHLPEISELLLVLFLQSCYYSNEQAKQAIENFFTVRTICKELFRNGDPRDPAIQMALDVGLVHFLPKTAPNGYKVLMCRLLDTNPDKYIYIDQLRMFDMIVTLELYLNGPNEGVIIVFDMAGSVFGHLLRVSPAIAKKYLYYVQEALPVRLKDIRIINVTSWVDKLLALFKPLMKKELFDMINVHSSMDTFYEVVPKDILPKEYGGSDSMTLKTMAESTKKTLLENPEFFQRQVKRLTDESKRVGKATDYSKIFGVEGTFKKLEVD